jgi:hypothetical protein
MGKATATTSSAAFIRIHNAIPISIFTTARLTTNTKPTTTAHIVQVTVNFVPTMAALAATALVANA